VTREGRVGVIALGGFEVLVEEGSGRTGMGMGLGGTGGASSSAAGARLKGLFVTGSFSMSP
jgi:hypothetical protein